MFLASLLFCGKNREMWSKSFVIFCLKCWSQILARWKVLFGQSSLVLVHNCLFSGDVVEIRHSDGTASRALGCKPPDCRFESSTHPCVSGIHFPRLDALVHTYPVVRSNNWNELCWYYVVILVSIVQIWRREYASKFEAHFTTTWL